MTSLKQFRGYWPLDYDWSKRGGIWTEFTDVMLIGKIKTECSNSALLAWVRSQDIDLARVDGIEREIFYAGGVQGYLDRQTDETYHSNTIYLHSHGQDCFDSLSYYSKEIYNYLSTRCKNVDLVWVEARHDRNNHQLQWP